MMQRHLPHSGFSLIELLATIVIGLIVAMAAIPQLQQRYKQSQVDAYTSRLEAGINQMKAQMISRQNPCEVDLLPLGAGGETEIKPSDLEKLQLENPQCLNESFVDNSGTVALSMNQPQLRFVNIKNSLSPSQSNDIRLLISPSKLSLTPIATSSYNAGETFTIRIRSASLHSQSKGFERCLKLAPDSPIVTRGTWIGSTFSQGSCNRNQ